MDGKADLALKGTVTPLSGAFDLNILGNTQNVRMGISQADALMQGNTQLTMQVQRDETGTFLRDILLRNDALSFVGAAELRTEDSDVTGQFQLNDVALVVPQYNGPVTARATAQQDAQGWRIDATTDGPYGAVLSAKGLATGPNAALSFRADVPNIEPMAKPFVRELNGKLDGPVKIAGTLRQSPEGWQVETEGSGPFRSSVALNGLVTPKIDMEFDVAMPSVTPLAAQLVGPLAATGRVLQTQNGFEIETNVAGPYDVTADISGPLTPALDLAYALRLPELEPLVPQVSGPLSATGRLQQTEAGFVLQSDARGPYQSNVKVNGALTPAIDVRFEAALPNLRPLVPQANGAASAQGRLRQTDKGFFIDTTASGPAGARAAVEGLATGPNMQLTFDASVEDVNPFVSGVSGPLSAKGVVRQTPSGIVVNTNATGPYATRANLQGVVTGPEATLDFTLAMPNIGVLVDKVNGPLDLRGTARKEGTAWRLNTNADGPSGTQATVAGLVNENGTLALSINGTAPLGLSRPFIAPRNLQGQARFDLTVSGPPALSSLEGRIQTSNASLSAPNLRFALTDITGSVDLGRNRANLDVTGNASNGGRLRAGGGVTLTPSLPADISLALEDIVLIDPRLYRTSVSGAIRVSGPLTGGAQVSGTVNVGETNVNVPSTGLTSIGEIPHITHVGAGPGVTTTRRKAGLTGTEAGSAPSGGSSGPGYGLDLRVNAPNRIFVRGRGLDAELGGGLSLTGSTNRVISAGRFELIRGRLDILGKRFNLEEGAIDFQGDLVPFLRFVSATDTEAGEVRVIVEGPADAPEVSFESTPAGPQDEVLSQLLFGRNIAEISAFQALQLASAVATLAGRGGNGIISNLREGFGLDDLDVTTTEDGATALRLGKYLSENVYTDVTATSDGEAEVSLNLDIRPNLTGKATLGSDGESSIGVFFEKDY
jgi:translocation and assembly module TamB